MAEKYASLPYIDANQKDTYETEGTCEEGRSGNANDLTSEAVDHYKINHKEAFDAFKDRYVDSSGLDFSEKIGSGKKNGYDTRTVYEIIGEVVAKETPQQKYQRLQHELQQFAEEISQISETVESSDKEAKMSPVVLANEVSQLQKQLQDLHLEKVIGTQQLAAGPQGSWLGQIMNQVETFKTKSVGKEAGDREHVSYELFCRPEHAKFNQTTKVAELEKRLKGMEDLIGKDSQKMAGIIAEPENSDLSLMDIVTILRTKMSLFDPTNIDIVDSRLQGVLQHVLQLGNKKEAIENADKESKVTELYEIMHKWDGLADVVPELANRLRALKSLHEQASSFAQSMTQLESTQSQIKDNLKSQKEMLQKACCEGCLKWLARENLSQCENGVAYFSEVEGNFGENMQAIQANCNSIDARVTALLEKMG